MIIGGVVIGRGKKNKKAKQKLKRMKKIKQGKNVPFNLQNSPRKYQGFSNKYCYQSNMHRLIYKEAKFNNIKFQSSTITQCNYSMAKFIGVDFCHSNLKKSNFKKAYFENVIFFNCNLKECNFEDAIFNNVVFISTNVLVANNLILNDNCRVIKKYPEIEISTNLLNNILALAKDEQLFGLHILNISKTKINLWILNLLLETTTQYDLSRCLYALKLRKNKRFFYTVHSYRRFIDSYLKRSYNNECTAPEQSNL